MSQIDIKGISTAMETVILLIVFMGIAVAVVGYIFGIFSGLTQTDAPLVQLYNLHRNEFRLGGASILMSTSKGYDIDVVKSETGAPGVEPTPVAPGSSIRKFSINYFVSDAFRSTDYALWSMANTIKNNASISDLSKYNIFSWGVYKVEGTLYTWDELKASRASLPAIPV